MGGSVRRRTGHSSVRSCCEHGGLGCEMALCRGPVRANVGVVWRHYALARLLQMFLPNPLVASWSLLSLTQELGASPQ